MLRPINPPGNPIPGISQGMLIEGGRLLVLSGHVPLDEHGKIPSDSLEAQLDLTFANLQKTLAAAGVGFKQVARLTIYVRDYTVEDLPVIRAVRDRWVGRDHAPASALVGVSALFQAGVRVEVDALAVVD